MALLINPYSRTVGHMICYRREGGKTPPHGGMGFTTHCTLERKCAFINILEEVQVDVAARE